jgi:hypothetical protein
LQLVQETEEPEHALQLESQLIHWLFEFKNFPSIQLVHFEEVVWQVKQEASQVNVVYN